MKGVPPEIDALLWRLAEEGGPVARAEFEARHARYGPELARRIHMVEELRQAGRTVVHRPAFTPRPNRAMAPKWAIGSAAGMGILAIGALAYVVASSGERPTTPASPTPIKTTPAVAPPTIVYQPTPPEPKPSTDVKPDVQPPATQVPAPKYLAVRDVRIADTALTGAIQLVAVSGGLQVTIAPGFEDRKVSFDYRQVTTIDALRAMGNEFGFSVLEEQEGHVLVVPVKSDLPDRRVSP